jgi:hypothetical protein
MLAGPRGGRVASGSVTGRVAMVISALAAVVLLWSWLGAARDYTRAFDLMESSSGDLSPARAERARLALRAAGRRTPSTEPEVAIAQLDLFLGQSRRAAAELRHVVRREPDNATAWGLLASALGRINKPASRRAARHEARLRAGFVRPRD